MKMEKLNSNVKVAEAATVTQAIGKASAKENFSQDAYFSNMLSSVSDIEIKLTRAINQDGAISALEGKDWFRDNLLRSAFYLHKGYLNYPIDSVAEAAKIIEPILDKYGFKIIDESYVIESAHVESMLTDLEAPDAKAAIDKLPGMSVLITHIRKAQQEFMGSYVTYKEIKAQQDDFASATDLKIEALELINGQLVVYLRAMMQAQPNLYGRFADTVSQIISDTNMAVKRRNKSAEVVE